MGASGSAGSAGAAGAVGSAGAAGAVGAGGSADSGPCDDSMGLLGDCVAVMSSICSSYGANWCQRANTNFKPKVAKGTSDCMLAGSASTCGSTCARSTLATACADPSADADCADYVIKCSSTVPITAAGCHALIDGLNSTGRAGVRACVNSDAGSCRYGIFSCIEGL